MDATKIKNCENLLYADPRFKYFFDISLPAALARGQRIGHILLVCSDKEATESFIYLLNEKTASFETQRCLAPTASMKAGDLCALVTNLQENAKLILINKRLEFNEECHDFLVHALKDFTAEISVGKGPSARPVSIDLPQFTWVVCVEHGSHSLSNLLPCFEYVIKIDEDNLPRICIAKVKSEANGVITDDACEYIAHKAGYDIQLSIKYLSRVLEYQQVTTRQKAITRELVEEIFDLSGVGATIEETIDDDEIYSLFRVIRDSLGAIQEDIHAMRGNMDDFLRVNDSEW